MCTMIVEKREIQGCGKGADGWFPLRQANVSYDHPYRMPLDHALSIDFVNPERGLGARIAVELDPASARQLAEAILSALRQGETSAAAGAAIQETAPRAVPMQG